MRQSFIAVILLSQVLLSCGKDEDEFPSFVNVQPSPKNTLAEGWAVEEREAAARMAAARMTFDPSLNIFKDNENPSIANS